MTVRPRFPSGFTFLVGYVVLIGNPWLTRWLLEHQPEWLRTPAYYLLWPAWDLPADSHRDGLPYGLAGIDTLIRAVLFLGIAYLVLRRLAAPLALGRTLLGRYAAGFGGVVLAAALTAVVSGLVTRNRPGQVVAGLAELYEGGYDASRYYAGLLIHALMFALVAGSVVGLRLAQQAADGGSALAVSPGTGPPEARPAGATSFGTTGWATTPIGVTAPIPGRSVEGRDEATRYLCVAARTDEAFTDRIVREVLGTDLRAVAPSVGIDLAPILWHAFAGWRLRRIRDGVVLAAVLLALVLAPLFSAAVLLAGPLVGMMSSRPQLRREQLVIPPLVVLGLILVGAWQLSPDDGRDPGPVLGHPLLALVPLAIAYGAIMWQVLENRQSVARQLRSATFQARPCPDAPPGTDWQVQPRALQQRLQHVLAAQHGNVTVYAGYRPFVGAGPTSNSWAFTLPILSVNRAGTPGGQGSGPGEPGPEPEDIHGERAAGPSIDIVDLIDRVRERLRALDAPIVPTQGGRSTPRGGDRPGGDRPGGADLTEAGLPGLVVADHVFVSGTEAGANGMLTGAEGSAPRQQLSPAEVVQIACRPRGPVRHYLVAQVSAWGGEIVASSFLHFSTEGRLLNVECEHTVLPPLRPEFHDVDRMTEDTTPGDVVRALAQTVQSIAAMAAAAPGRILRDLTFRRRYREGHLREHLLAREDRGYNYGAQASVRELGMAQRYHNYFQVLDATKYHRVIERHVLAAILDYLDEHGIDTTELRHRQMTILNHGLVQTGGVSIVGQQAVGTGSAVVNQPADGSRVAGRQGSEQDD